MPPEGKVDRKQADFHIVVLVFFGRVSLVYCCFRFNSKPEESVSYSPCTGPVIFPDHIHSSFIPSLLPLFFCPFSFCLFLFVPTRLSLLFCPSTSEVWYPLDNKGVLG